MLSPFQGFFFVMGIPLSIVWNLIAMLFRGSPFRGGEDMLPLIRLLMETVVCGVITVVGLISLAIFGVVKLCCG